MPPHEISGSAPGERRITRYWATWTQLAPNARLRPDARFTDNGKIVTTGGISAGIDASFHLVARLHGLDVARATARYMEYDWTPERTYDRKVVSRGA